MTFENPNGARPRRKSHQASHRKAQGLISRLSAGPPPGLQRWARFTLRYVIGGGGIIYETVVDHFHNATALVIFGGIAGITDVIGYAQIVKQQAQADAEEDRA